MIDARRTSSVVTFTSLTLSLLACGTAFPQDAAAQAEAQPAASAATSSIDQDIALLRKNLRGQRKKIIAANLPLTPNEAEKFWPIYEQYVGELVRINDVKYALIKQYVQASGTITDDQADASVKQWLGVDESVNQLKTKYVPIFRKVLSAKNTALFYQLDRRVQLMIDLQLASQLPLIEP